MWPSSIPHKVSCWPNTLGAAAEMFWKKGKFSLGSLLLQLDLKDNAVDVARIPTDKVAIASVHPGIGEEEHEELHGRSWVFHHNVPGDDVHSVPLFTVFQVTRCICYVAVIQAVVREKPECESSSTLTSASTSQVECLSETESECAMRRGAGEHQSMKV